MAMLADTKQARVDSRACSDARKRSRARTALSVDLFKVGANNARVRVHAPKHGRACNDHRRRNCCKQNDPSLPACEKAAGLFACKAMKGHVRVAGTCWSTTEMRSALTTSCEIPPLCNEGTGGKSDRSITLTDVQSAHAGQAAKAGDMEKVRHAQRHAAQPGSKCTGEQVPNAPEAPAIASDHFPGPTLCVQPAVGTSCPIKLTAARLHFEFTRASTTSDLHARFQRSFHAARLLQARYTAACLFRGAQPDAAPFGLRTAISRLQRTQRIIADSRNDGRLPTQQAIACKKCGSDTLAVGNEGAPSVLNRYYQTQMQPH